MDYQAVLNQELIFPSGSTTNSAVCLNITVYNNTVIQSDRSFAVNVQRVDTSVVLAGITTTTVVIKPNPTDRKQS